MQKNISKSGQKHEEKSFGYDILTSIEEIIQSMICPTRPVLLTDVYVSTVTRRLATCQSLRYQASCMTKENRQRV